MGRTPGQNDALKQLLRSAGFTYQNVDRKHVQMLFGSALRTWVVGATLNEYWLSLTTYVCDVPSTPRTKAALFDLMMQMNDEGTLAKYSYRGTAINLELQYRREHLVAEVIDGLVGLLLNCAKLDYPRIVRLLAEDDVLERLGKQFETPNADADEGPITP